MYKNDNESQYLIKNQFRILVNIIQMLQIRLTLTRAHLLIKLNINYNFAKN